MQNKKLILGALVVVILISFGFVTNQVFTQLSLGSPFAQVASIFKLNSNSPATTLITPPETPPGRGGPGDGPGEGWTDLIPSDTSKIVYISSNGTATGNACVYTMPSGSRPFGGSDPYNPTNAITPCGGTIRSNYDDDTKIRPGQDDYLLLKRGDTWNVSPGALQIRKSGVSASRKMVIGSWSNTGNTNRPLLLASTVAGDVISGSGGFHHVALTDLHVKMNNSDTQPIQGSFGIGMYICSGGPASNFLMENMKIERFATGVSIYSDNTPNCNGSRASNFTIRRNIFADSFSQNNLDSNGLLGFGDNFVFEENIFSRNGCETRLSPCQGDFRGHNIYVSMHAGDSTNLTVRQNYFTAGIDGGKLGSTQGGLIEDNTFSRNAISVLECCEVGQNLINNVVIDAADYRQDFARGWGFHLGGLANSLVKGNIFAHQRTGTGAWDIPAMKLSGGSNSQIINNIVYNWCGPTSSDHDGSAIMLDSNGYPGSLLIENNQFQQNCPSGFVGHVYKEETNNGGSGAVWRNNKYWINGSRFVSYGGNMNGPSGTFANWVSAVGETGSTMINLASPNTPVGQRYTDPNRDYATYHNLLFGTNHAFRSEAGINAYDDKLRLQSKWNWDERLESGTFNDYIRCGFNMAPLHGTCSGGGGGDTQPPVVSLTAPANGATVSATVPVSATATDNVAVAKVEFYRGTTLIGTDTSASSGNVYSVNWNTTQSPNGSHIITAKAYDTATPTPNTATSQPRTVTVNNGLAAGCQRYDMDLSGALTSNDFVAYQNAYTAGDMRADMDDSGYLTANDYIAFLNGYVRCI